MATPDPTTTNQLTQRQMAEALRVTSRHFRERYQPHVAPSSMVGEGSNLRFHLGAIRDILDAELAKAEAKRSGNDDPMFADADSPALERYRTAKAAQEEIKLAEMRGEFASMARVRERLDSGAAILRRCGEQIERQYGDGPATLFREHLDEWAKGLEIDLSGGSDDE